MGAVRRSTALALAALAALLLLLLARLPPGPPAPSVPRPRPLVSAPLTLTLRSSPSPSPSPSVASAPVSLTPPPPTNRTTARPTATRRTPPPPPPPKPKPAAAAANVSQPAKSSPRPVLTGDVYVAGHERPHPELCPALGARLRLMILVTSAPSHRAARDAIRLTWGHYGTRTDVAIAFVLGAPPDALRPALETEDALYSDLIVSRSLDSYSNLTLKTLSMLEWMDAYCPRAPRLLKTDDDMFINVPRLLDFAFAPARANASSTVWGRVIKKSLPKRTTRSKYYVSPVQYPARVFPDFATGPAYLMTADAIRPLLEAAPSERYLRLEDVFVTGVLAARLKIRRVHAPEFYNKKLALHPCAVQRAISIHMVRYHEQFDLWRKLLDGKTKCT
ncbi:unnamed protein product [Chilo suppressalis]|uniref:Hexosyltransferase n=1 Tax=Chilo suppressalis TaxID=168631 RepID=A0ABN8BAL9_CHISP|nr:unnamed protein product [Chilo suppressalis]